MCGCASRVPSTCLYGRTTLQRRGHYDTPSVNTSRLTRRLFACKFDREPLSGRRWMESSPTPGYTDGGHSVTSRAAPPVSAMQTARGERVPTGERTNSSENCRSSRSGIVGNWAPTGVWPPISVGQRPVGNRVGQLGSGLLDSGAVRRLCRSVVACIVSPVGNRGAVPSSHALNAGRSGDSGFSAIRPSDR